MTIFHSPIHFYVTVFSLHLKASDLYTVTTISPMLTIVQLTKKHREGRIEKVDWLDRLTFREIEQINERHKRISKQMYLMVEFPEVFFKDTKFAVVYFESGGDEAFPFQSKPSNVIFHDSTLSMVSQRGHHCKSTFLIMHVHVCYLTKLFMQKFSLPHVTQ